MSVSSNCKDWNLTCPKLRVFPHRSFRIANLCVLGLVIATGTAVTLTIIFQCTPVGIASLPFPSSNRGLMLMIQLGSGIVRWRLDV